MFGSKFFANVSVCKERRGLKAVNFAIRKFFQRVKGFVYRITPAFICTLVSNRFSRSHHKFGYGVDPCDTKSPNPTNAAKSIFFDKTTFYGKFSDSHSPSDDFNAPIRLMTLDELNKERKSDQKKPKMSDIENSPTISKSRLLNGDVDIKWFI